MADFAIIKSGGKQYRVAKGEKVELELLDSSDKQVEFETLLVNKSGKIEVGKPFLKSKVKGEILKDIKGEKIDIRTFKAKSRHRRHIGHRQKYSLVEIKSI